MSTSPEPSASVPRRETNLRFSDGHIQALSGLTGEPAAAIRGWFSHVLKQGLAGQDSGYKSQQTGLSLPDLTFANTNDTGSQSKTSGTASKTEPTTAPPIRGGRKGCKPTNNPELLRRDENKIYQCTRKCGKRYGRKCDWKRNEEEGYPSKSWVCSLCISQGAQNVKPCFRRYHFTQVSSVSSYTRNLLTIEALPQHPRRR